jgi:hypothetical protein
MSEKYIWVRFVRYLSDDIFLNFFMSKKVKLQPKLRQLAYSEKIVPC